MNIIKPNVQIMTPIDGDFILKHLEACGRTCYRSEDKVTDTSAEKFIRNILKRGHEAVIEHYAITVRFTCDRGVTHEIVRHRLASYSQESTRYCNYSQDKFDNNVTYIDLEGGIELDPVCSKMDADTINAILAEWYAACVDAERHYFKMLELGAPPQIARSVLNNSTKTELVMTANIREWRHFFKLRCDRAAHPQMREVAIMLLNQFKEQIPVLFDDIEVEG